MPIKFKPKLLPLKKEEELKTLVENRSVYALPHCELNVFETHQASEKVKLVFNDMVLTTMLRGKKVMHLFGSQHFDYLPGESVIVPNYEEMVIDFPEADRDNPTQCLALAVDGDILKDTLQLLNDKYPKAETGDSWNIDLSCFHLQNSLEITATIDRLVRISTEPIAAKDVLADFTLKELLIRLMQTQARQLILDSYHKHTGNRFAYVVQYIKDHLHEEITVDKLSNLCCMSKPNFFRCFKREFGISPVDFVVQERLKQAKTLLGDVSMSVSEACYASGFKDLSYFFKLFKRIEGVTPNEYRRRLN
ncbi:AraC family transcriptional regulator [Mucilaginibacter sp. RS28]|uniref:AraC family transcriptional regulator n=1 Tax=Mucilaginibacter straminoryzae TaxID=2932774 RepID=A0A9X2B809_9SPHI|nr:AraC family transcriptional regulator [Mucilaginibacter straminoryzae]MCJ8209144.1 AraC family transcriptional regulator [Mucilaginibacter straminoryzae]